MTHPPHLDKETCNDYLHGRSDAREGGIRQAGSVSRHASPHRRDFFAPIGRTSGDRSFGQSRSGPRVEAGRDGAPGEVDPCPFGCDVPASDAVRPRRPREARHVLLPGLVLPLRSRLVFFFSLVRIQVKFDTMKDHWLFLGILYTAGVAFLSYVFLFSWQKFQWAGWQLRVARNFGITPSRRSGARLPALHAVFLADGEVRRGRDLLDAAAAGSAGRLVLSRR